MYNDLVVLRVSEGQGSFQVGKEVEVLRTLQQAMDLHIEYSTDTVKMSGNMNSNSAFKEKQRQIIFVHVRLCFFVHSAVVMITSCYLWSEHPDV